MQPDNNKDNAPERPETPIRRHPDFIRQMGVDWVAANEPDTIAPSHDPTDPKAEMLWQRVEEMRRNTNALDERRRANPGELIIETGGTLACKPDKQGATPGRSVEELLQQPFKGDQNLKLINNGQEAEVILPLPESPYYFARRVDSSQLQPEDFIRIAEICYKALLDESIACVTILAGTDTAEYLGAALARMISHPNKSITVIGSMKMLDEEGSDVLPNLHRGRYANFHMDPGVYVCLDGDVHDAKRVVKKDSEATDSFSSQGAQPVATFHHLGSKDIPLGLSYHKRIELLHHYELERELEEVWDWCQEHKEPHKKYENCGVHFHTKEAGEKDAALQEWREYWTLLKELYTEYHMLMEEAELRSPPTPILNTKLDNQVYYERMTPGYRAQWLRELLQKGDIHGVLLDGISEVDLDTRLEILKIIEEYAGVKPIVTMEDPEGLDSPMVKGFHQFARKMNAIPSDGLTVAYASICLKWFLGQEGLPLSDIRTGWKFAEDVGGPGYLPKGPGEPSEVSVEEPEVFEVEKNIRYIQLIPGWEPAWLERILMDSELDAVIIAPFGAGNIPFENDPENPDIDRNLLDVIKKHTGDIPIVFRTQCESGPTNLAAYYPGVLATDEGVLSAGNRTLHQTIKDLDRLLVAGLKPQRYWKSPSEHPEH